MNDNTDVRRRQLLICTAGAAAAGLSGISLPSLAQSGGAKPLPPYAAWKDANSVIVHSANTIETRRAALGDGVITSEDILFVRNNLPPAVDEAAIGNRDAWELKVEGVGRPGTLRLAELKQMGITAVASVLQCSGNGRGFFPHKASGTQWKVGASGCVIWTGVPVSTVAKAMGGVSDGMKFITGTGGEKLPAGVDRKKAIVERSVPLAALDTALLAWEVNGMPLPLAHGGPLRLVFPGYFGINNIKYIDHLAFTPKETDVAIHSTGYRVRPVGQKGAPTQPSMWEMPVKSFVTHPAGPDERLPAGMVQITGVAFAGVNAVKGVEVSLDGGKSWEQAQFFGPDLGRYAWRAFVLAARMDPGIYKIASRATDSAGNTQPEHRLENERGYGHNGWLDHIVEMRVG